MENHLSLYITPQNSGEFKEKFLTLPGLRFGVACSYRVTYNDASQRRPKK
jgi:hypothetical protein